MKKNGLLNLSILQFSSTNARPRKAQLQINIDKYVTANPGMTHLHVLGKNYLKTVTPKPSKWIFMNIEKVDNRYQFLMVRFIKVVHPTRYSEIEGFYDKIGQFSPIKDIIRNVTKMGQKGPFW